MILRERALSRQSYHSQLYSPTFKTQPPFVIREIIKLSKQLLNYPDKLFYLRATNPSCKAKRVERIVAIINLITCLALFYDLETQTTKFPTLNYIAKRTGMNHKRVKRAFCDLCKAGYIESKKQYKRYQPGVFKGIASIKIFTKTFFAHLGISLKKLDKAKAYKQQLRREQQSVINSEIDVFKNIHKKAIRKTTTHLKSYTEKIPRQVIDLIKKKSAFS